MSAHVVDTVWSLACTLDHAAGIGSAVDVVFGWDVVLAMLKPGVVGDMHCSYDRLLLKVDVACRWH